MCGIAVVAGTLLLLWQKWLELPAKPVYGAACIATGLVFFGISLVSRRRRVFMAVFVALVPFGIALPLCSGQQSVYVVGGIMEIVVGAVAAGIMAGQLRAERSIRERATNRL